MVLVIKGGGGDMMAVVPAGVGQLAVVGVVRYDLFAGDFEAGGVTHARGKFENALGF